MANDIKTICSFVADRIDRMRLQECTAVRQQCCIARHLHRRDTNFPLADTKTYKISLCPFSFSVHAVVVFCGGKNA